MKIVAREKTPYQAFATPYNSPLTPMIKKGLLSMSENGLKKILATKWEGAEFVNVRQLGTIVLSLGQTVLVYVIIAASSVISILILIVEVTYKKYTTILF
jgi:hypothetical protein